MREVCTRRIRGKSSLGESLVPKPCGIGGDLLSPLDKVSNWWGSGLFIPPLGLTASCDLELTSDERSAGVCGIGPGSAHGPFGYSLSAPGLLDERPPDDATRGMLEKKREWL